MVAACLQTTWTRRLFTDIAIALVLGLLMTILSAATGFSLRGCVPRFGATSFVPDHADMTHWVGWTIDESGKEVSLHDDLGTRRYEWHRRMIVSARAGGRPYQHLLYEHLQRGYPWVWLRYFEGYDGYGTHRNVPQENLRKYPRWRFESIRWGAFLANTGFWSVFPFLMSNALRLCRAMYRGRRGCCHKCGYDLRGLPEPRCPECSTPFDPGSFNADQLASRKPEA